MDDSLKNKILLTKDGKAILHDFDDETEEWTSGEILEHNILFHLHDPIVLGEGFTLRNYFYLIENYPLFMYIDYFLSCFIEEFRECPESGCTDEEGDIDELCLNRIMNYEAPRSIKPMGIFFCEDILKEDDGLIHSEEYIQYDIDFHGVSKDGENYYALEFSPLTELLDHKVVIGNAKISIELPGNLDDYDNIQDKYIIRETKDDNYTLYEFVKEIIWELSFCGCPENRKKKSEEIKERLEEAEKEIEERRNHNE